VSPGSAFKRDRLGLVLPEKVKFQSQILHCHWHWSPSSACFNRHNQAKMDDSRRASRTSIQLQVLHSFDLPPPDLGAIIRVHSRRLSGIITRPGYFLFFWRSHYRFNLVTVRLWEVLPRFKVAETAGLVLLKWSWDWDWLFFLP